MTQTHASEQARHALAASIAGKTKELAGAVLGNDALAARGSLQQAEANARKDAATTTALAHSRATEAHTELRQVQTLAAKQQQAVAAAADVRDQQVRDRAHHEQARADQQADQQQRNELAAAHATTVAKTEVQTARTQAALSQVAADQRAATDAHQVELSHAAAALRAADRARDEADQLASAAGLPKGSAPVTGSTSRDISR